MEAGALGKECDDQEVICRQGDPGDCMYVIQAGRAVVLREEAGDEVVGELQIHDGPPVTLPDTETSARGCSSDSAGSPRPTWLSERPGRA